MQFASLQEIDGPRAARPALVGWLGGGRQQFPNDPVLDAARERALRTAGMIKSRRIPAKEVA